MYKGYHMKLCFPTSCLNSVFHNCELFENFNKLKIKTLIVFFASYCNVFKITFVISTKEALACWGVKCKRPADKLFIKGAGDFTSNLIFHVVHNGIEVSWVGIVCSLIRTIQLSWNWRKQTINVTMATLSLLFSFILHLYFASLEAFNDVFTLANSNLFVACKTNKEIP